MAFKSLALVLAKHLTIIFRTKARELTVGASLYSQKGGITCVDRLSQSLSTWQTSSISGESNH